MNVSYFKVRYKGHHGEMDGLFFFNEFVRYEFHCS